MLVLETIRGPAIFSEDDMPFVQSIADLIALAIDRDRLAARADVIREERRAERLRSEVLATLSHELRLPLTAIQGYSSALLMDEVDWSDEKRREFLHLIEDKLNQHADHAQRHPQFFFDRCRSADHGTPAYPLAEYRP